MVRRGDPSTADSLGVLLNQSVDSERYRGVAVHEPVAPFFRSIPRVRRFSVQVKAPTHDISASVKLDCRQTVHKMETALNTSTIASGIGAIMVSLV
jgi:hypothetical protein